MKREVEVLVVGGGPAGLATAYALQRDCVVVEKESRVGGLCRSIEHEGGVFDIGGHSFHTPHPEVFELVKDLLGDDLYLQTRDARVYTHGTLIPYPFQKFFDRLPDPDVVRECETGLREPPSDHGEPRDFEEYIIRKFGRGIADHFMLPYNRKLWARDISKISCEWTSERVAGAKGTKEKFEATDGRRRPLQPDTRVGYPRDGGFEKIYSALAARVPELVLNAEVVSIDPKDRRALTRTGAQYDWRVLVSTMPLPILTRIVKGTPKRIIEAADRLEYMSLRVELLLTKAPLETPIQRIYCADADVPPHKTAFNNNSSDLLRQRPHHGIMAEVSVSEEKEVNVEEIAPKTIEFLCELGVLSKPEEIVWRSHVDVQYAYPVYTHERPGLLSEIKSWLQERGIFSTGRFGDWEYVNSDRCVMKGLTLGRELREQLGRSGEDPIRTVSRA
jgi:protoporphyrinogen oxidase